MCLSLKNCTSNELHLSNKYNCEPDSSLDSQLTTPIFFPTSSLTALAGFLPSPIGHTGSKCMRAEQVDFDSKLSKNSELLLELMSNLSRKEFRKTLHKQSAFCASCLDGPSKHKSVLALLRTSLGPPTSCDLLLTRNTDSLKR